MGAKAVCRGKSSLQYSGPAFRTPVAGKRAFYLIREAVYKTSSRFVLTGSFGDVIGKFHEL